MIVQTLQEARVEVERRWDEMDAVKKMAIQERYRALRAMARYTHGETKEIDETRAAIDRMCATHNV